MQALEKAPTEQREGIQFLVANMPPRDLEHLSADFLLENLTRAYQAMQEAPWAKSIPATSFSTMCCPYASADRATG